MDYKEGERRTALLHDICYQMSCMLYVLLCECLTNEEHMDKNDRVVDSRVAFECLKERHP